MNKALLHKLLIAGLIVIWSLVGYKFLKGASADSVDPIVAAVVTPKAKKESLPEFKLTPLKRDPFLNTITAPKKAVKKDKSKGRLRTLPKDTKTIWPTIEYFGYVQKNKQSAPLALIKINNELLRIRAGESYQLLEIAKVYKDSITVKMGPFERNFPKAD